ncbi:MAG: DUF4340 domain-containing protein [Oscillospiraceae bacterium]|nr:DUF4340 domain-containing protein [Oscillospiraceae bacterium]
MRSLIRCAIIGGCVVAALAAVYAALLFSPAQPAFDGEIFSARPPDAIQSVTVANAAGTFSFYFDFEDGGYVVDEIPPHIVDFDKFMRFMQNSAQVAAIRRIPAAGADLRDFGLYPPAASVEVKFFDGGSLQMDIGGVERVSGHYFAAVEGYDDVFIIPQGIAGQFLRPATQIISLYVTPPLMVTSPLSVIRDITFSGTSLAQPVTIHATAQADEEIALAALSFGAPTHIVRGAAAYQLDQAYGLHILGALFDIPAVEIVAFGLDDAEIAAFGFDDAYLAIDYDMINGMEAQLVQMRLRFIPAQDGRFYATLLGSGAVYLVEREPFFDIEYERLLLRWFLTPLLMDLASVTIELPGRTHRLDIDVSDPRSPAVYYGGQPLDMRLFHAFFRLITSAAHDGAYLGALSPPDDEQPLLTITYEYLNPNKPPDVMALYPGDVRRVNVFVNGVSEFAMRDMFVQRAGEGIENLLAGHPIEENW